MTEPLNVDREKIVRLHDGRAGVLLSAGQLVWTERGPALILTPPPEPSNG